MSGVDVVVDVDAAGLPLAEREALALRSSPSSRTRDRRSRHLRGLVARSRRDACDELFVSRRYLAFGAVNPLTQLLDLGSMFGVKGILTESRLDIMEGFDVTTQVY